MRDGLVQMKATTFFTRNSPTTAAILHGDDRDEADVVARFPRVTPADADYLEGEKLAERFDGRVPEEREGGGPAATVGERAAEEVEEVNDSEESVTRTTGLATRATTRHQQPPNAVAGRQGSTAAVMDADDGGRAPAEEDEAPATGRRGRAARAGAASEDQ